VVCAGRSESVQRIRSDGLKLRTNSVVVYCSLVQCLVDVHCLRVV
jgi:hypothetical protein